MDPFNCRISLDEASALVRSAMDSGLLGDRSAIFHDLRLLRRRLAALDDAFPPSCLHTIAIKANPVVEILREVVQVGAGLEAASIEEVAVALAAGCPAGRIVFDSPAKTAAEINFALDLGVYLNADNFEELERVAAAPGRYGSASLVGLRVNTMVGSGAIEHTSVSAADSKFGVPLQTDREAIVEAFRKHRWLTGLHVHVGSQGCPLELLVEAAARIDELREEIDRRAERRVSHVDIGGGLATSYHTGEQAPTPRDYRQRLEQRAPGLFAGDVRLITEFGRAVQANCGIAASRVEYVKPEQQLAYIHLGADFLLRTVYRPDDWPHEFFVLDRHGLPKSGHPQPITLAGPLCFAGDVVAREIALPPVEVGDWIVIRDVGAYTLSMWSRHCSRSIPSVIGYETPNRNSLRVLRNAETADDVAHFWSRQGPGA